MMMSAILPGSQPAPIPVRCLAVSPLPLVIWQVRAANGSGTTYADGSSTAWRSFTVLPIPGAFNKIDPPNGATGLLTNPTLSWGPSSNVSYYQYCVNTAVASCTSWTNTINTYANLSGLTPGVQILLAGACQE